MADLCYLSKEFMHSPVLPFHRDSDLCLSLGKNYCFIYKMACKSCIFILSNENLCLCVCNLQMCLPLFFLCVFLANPYNWIKMASNAHRWGHQRSELIQRSGPHRKSTNMQVSSRKNLQIKNTKHCFCLPLINLLINYDLMYSIIEQNYCYNVHAGCHHVHSDYCVSDLYFSRLRSHLILGNSTNNYV